MKRQPIKTVSNEELRFIPSMYKEFDIKAKKVENRPLVLVGKRLKREDRYELDSMTHIKFNKDPDKVDYKNLKPGDIDVIGKGNASKYVWDKCMIKALNVITEEKGKVKTYEEYKDMEALWDGVGMDVEIAEAVEFFLKQSKLDEVEAKN